MPDTKNLIFAIVFSTAILFLWQTYYVAPRIEQVQKQQEMAIQAAKNRIVPTEIKSSTPISVKEALSHGGRIKINTPRLHGSIALKGARFDDLTLANYNISQDKDSPEVISCEIL